MTIRTRGCDWGVVVIIQGRSFRPRLRFGIRTRASLRGLSVGREVGRDSLWEGDRDRGGGATIAAVAGHMWKRFE